MTEPPMIKICGLYQNRSKSGRTYFVGVCGGVKYLLLENTQAEDGQPGWNLLLTPREKPQQATAHPQSGAATLQSSAPAAPSPS